MTTLSSAGKMRRVLEFMLGLRDDRVLGLLQSRGFGASDREQGWQLLRNLGMTQLVPPAVPGDTAIVTAIDRWRLEWMRIARVSVALSYPKAHDELFGGAQKKSETPLLATIRFVDRLDKLRSARDAASRSAMAKLATRGLTDERIDEVRALLDQFRRPAHQMRTRTDPNQRRSEIKKAEDSLWAYFIEWSEIAQAVVKDPRLLGRLGYREGTASADVEQAPVTDINPPTAAAMTSEAARSSTRGKPKKSKAVRTRKR